MLTLTDTDASLLRRVKRHALTAWVVAVTSGLLSWGASTLDFHGVASSLVVLMWLAGATFVLCWAILAVSVLVLLVSRFSGRNNGA